MDIVLIVAHASSLSALAPLALSFRAPVPLETKFLRVLLAGSCVFDLTSLLMALRGFNTYPIANLFFLFQAVVLMLLYYRKYSPSRLYLRIFGSMYITYFAVNYVVLQGPKVLSTYSIPVSGLILMAVALSYFVYLLRNLPEVFVHRMPLVWISIAVLIYYAGNLFLFIMNNYFSLGSEGTQRVMWIIHNSLNITKNTLFLVAIWQGSRKVN